MKPQTWLRLVSCFALSQVASANPQRQPNFVFIITDDQDQQLNSLAYQPAIQKHFAEQGVQLTKHYCTIAICCPSRVSLLTGKAAHNTNVTDVTAPYGGYTKFVSQGLNDNYLPVWLQAAGYNTYYAGKLMNGHSLGNYDKPYPAGWTDTNFFLDPSTYLYNNVTTQRKKETPVNNAGKYSTDLLSNISVGYINDANKARKPFFIGIAPIGPHSQTVITANGARFDPPVPAERHRDLFPNVTVPRTSNFNPDFAGAASYLKFTPRLNSTEVDYADEWYRLRLRSLQAVDDLIDSVISRLDQLNLLDNTYVIYTSDNGFHIGNHRMAPGKCSAYEEDVNVPFFIRGPGLPKGSVVDYPSTHTDIVPTLYTLAGLQLRPEFDGSPISLPLHQEEAHPRYEAINVEFWGVNIFEGKYATVYPNNTYKSVRLVSKHYSLSYTHWCTNEIELYDNSVDPYQIDNLYQAQGQLLGRQIPDVVSRLDVLLTVLMTCKGQVCVKPWKTLHPGGNVHSLKDALNPDFDYFYNSEAQKVHFRACALGYIAELEQPRSPSIYQHEPYKQGTDWQDWV